MADLQGLRDLERELERQGYLTRTDEGLKLTPRRCAGSARRPSSGCSPSSRRPAAATTTTAVRGQADERTGLTRPWVFGDELPLDAPRTVANALRRLRRPAAARAEPCSWRSRTSR